MSHFAKVVDGVVVRVIVAEQDFIDSYIDNEPGEWVQTSYNTHGGIHILGGTPLRFNFAAPGYTYDANRDAFIPPQPYASWLLDEQKMVWTPPTQRPDDGKSYDWNESVGGWVENTGAPE